MTAHPKVCTASGDMHFIGYGFFPPLLTYHRVDAAGALVQSEVIDVPAATMLHDCAITAHSVVFMDLPVVFEPSLITEGTMPYRWSDDYGARVGIMPRGGDGFETRWFEVEPCYAFHVLNASETIPGRVVVDVVRYPELWRESGDRFDRAALHRWSIDGSTGNVKEEQLDDPSGRVSPHRRAPHRAPVPVRLRRPPAR